MEAPPTSKQVGAKEFVAGFLQNSRLSFLGRWRRRYDLLVDSRPPPPPLLLLSPSGGERVVFHVDLDAFFCTASLLDKTSEAKAKPAAVCWCSSSESSSEISSCNYPARAVGIKAGMPLNRAKELCPALLTLAFDFALYEQLSLTFYQVLLDFSPHVEGVSCDEAFVDVTHLVVADKAVELANELRSAIASKTGGLTASVGCGVNKALARLCTSRAKPDGTFSSLNVPLEQVLHAELPVSALHSVGRSTVRALEQQFNARTVVDLQSVPLSALQQTFGPLAGKRLYALSRGEDDAKWNPKQDRSSVSVQISWGVRMDTRDEVDEFVYELCREVMSRLAGAVGDGVNVRVWRAAPNQSDHHRKGKIGHGACDVLTRQGKHLTTTLAGLAKFATELLGLANVPPGDIRGLGVAVSGLKPPRPDTSQRGIQAWLGGGKRQKVDFAQRLWDSGNHRHAVDKELVYAFEIAARCEVWPHCGESVHCCGEANIRAIQGGVLPLLRSLLSLGSEGARSDLIAYTRQACHNAYGVLPASHALSRFALAGGGVALLNDLLDDLG